MVTMSRPACARRVCLIRGDARVTPFRARVYRRPQGCPTRVQGLGVGGQLSKLSVSNVKSGELGPYRTYSASTWIPEQLPAPLDSARNEIGQCATGDGGRFWTAPATKSDSLSNRAGQGRARPSAGPGRWLAGAGRRCQVGQGSQRDGPAEWPTGALGTPAPSFPAMRLLQLGRQSGAIPRRQR